MTLVTKLYLFIQSLSGVCGFSFFILLLVTKPAYAYLDPGTGSMILQLLFGGVAGALLVGKLYFQQIRSYIAGLFGRQIQDDNREDGA